jgi:hypothetical protein
LVFLSKIFNSIDMACNISKTCNSK